MPTKLGQNFLKDNSVIGKIIAAANLRPDDFVIEIGPGKGILTEKLAEKAGKVSAIEIDRNLVEFLRNKFKDKKNIEIINADILKINLPELLGNQMSQYKIVANIPYYITSPIIRLFLEQKLQPEKMILMIQKEVAERIVAKPGEMSILAVAVQHYADSKILFDVPKTAFEPAPKVDSAVIEITPQKIFDKEKDARFFRIVRAGFSGKRKTLLNNFSASFHLDKKEAEEKLKTAGINPTVRAQELSLEDWKNLTKIFSNSEK